MGNPSRAVFVAAGLWFASLAGMAFAQPPSPQAIPFDEFAAFLRPRLPQSGTLELVYTSEKGAGEEACGYDAATGAWYKANSEIVALIDPSGRARAGPPRFNGLGTDSERASPGDSSAIDPFFPYIGLAHLLNHPEIFRSISRRADGGFRVCVGLPGGNRRLLDSSRILPGMEASEKPVWIDLDAAARVLRTWVGEEAAAPEQATEYDPRSPAEFPIPVRPVNVPAFKLASFTFTPGSNPAFFDAARIESLAVQTKLNVQTALAAKRKAGADIQEPTVPNALKQYRFPLVATGIVILSAAAIVLWRRRQ